MISLIGDGFPKTRASGLTGISRSMIYYRSRARNPGYDSYLEERIKALVEERPSYGSRRITAMLHREGIRSGRNRTGRHMRHLNLMHSAVNRYRKRVPRTILVSRPNLMWETDFTNVYSRHETVHAVYTLLSLIHLSLQAAHMTDREPPRKAGRLENLLFSQNSLAICNKIYLPRTSVHALDVENRH